MPQPSAVIADHLDRLRSESDPLVRVDSAHHVEEAAAELVRQVVAHARAAGHTWVEIAEQLGTSRQAASQRFREPAPTPAPTLTRQQRRAAARQEARS
jgi:hypothetical protein